MYSTKCLKNMFLSWLFFHPGHYHYRKNFKVFTWYSLSTISNAEKSIMLSFQGSCNNLCEHCLIVFFLFSIRKAPRRKSPSCFAETNATFVMNFSWRGKRLSRRKVANGLRRYVSTCRIWATSILFLSGLLIK